MVIPERSLSATQTRRTIKVRQSAAGWQYFHRTTQRIFELTLPSGGSARRGSFVRKGPPGPRQRSCQAGTIRSPIHGVVVERSLGPGEYAFDQSHLLTVSQIDPLNVEVWVPLSQFGRIHRGTLAEVYPEDPVGGRYPAIVTVVDQVFDAASGTIGIRLELSNPDYAIPAGLKCQVRFPGIG